MGTDGLLKALRAVFSEIGGLVLVQDVCEQMQDLHSAR